MTNEELRKEVYKINNKYIFIKIVAVCNFTV